MAPWRGPRAIPRACCGRHCGGWGPPRAAASGRLPFSWWGRRSPLRAAGGGGGPAEGSRIVSSAFYMVVPPFRAAGGEVLTFTDAGVVPDPNAEELAEIAAAAVVARKAIVGDEPRVAFLSYSTKGS